MNVKDSIFFFLFVSVAFFSSIFSSSVNDDLLNDDYFILRCVTDLNQPMRNNYKIYINEKNSLRNKNQLAVKTSFKRTLLLFLRAVKS